MTGRGRRKRARENDGGEQYKLIGSDTDDDVCDESEHHTGGEFV